MRLKHAKWKLQIAATVAYRAAAVRHLVRHSQSGGRPDWSDTDKPLRAAPKLKPPALPGDTYCKSKLCVLLRRPNNPVGESNDQSPDDRPAPLAAPTVRRGTSSTKRARATARSKAR